MNSKYLRIATGCLVGAITFSGMTMSAAAGTAGVTAGIGAVLTEAETANPNVDAQIKEYLVPTVKSEYSDIAIAQVDNYVNIRDSASEEGQILGKLYNNSAATVQGSEGDWYQITSGSVTGYVKGEYVVTGEAGEELAKQVGHRVAKVNTTTLYVRQEMNTESTILTLVPIDEELDVVEELDGWVKVSLDADVVGFVSSEYVDIRTDFVQAESIEEEQARLAKEEAAKQAAQNAARQADANSKSKSSKSGDSAVPTSGGEASGSRAAIINTALSVVGNPYVAGGTSLTNGADCSGFTMAVFANNGVGIPRDSRSQAAGGREISMDSVQPGDLLFYSNGGSINHVALYIGNGQVVHASTPQGGIKVSNYNYRSPVKAVSYLN
ncbi:SH3 domain-containing C40 family peptidase [Diplocloster agilis]|uniref:C40 family peptidase n=1 Tax=Diplocloster agilis TaxID=2850323 RepID=A0A949K909_9FIRM|nr:MULTISPECIES: SH3 domain-containing C40 family peptidase [Lachnospiraceae]MBU9739042.1 C40 family peptidase [Diplocloster agilis]MBU9742592.1 C40 family peptidase [Diplocloster agilis]MCU6735796.1 C40 family peptidase [Suonthocola fibrivorans]SCJ82071.1 Gamma-D-glutamyl-L-lysine endopeptidase [uncultured Clostridium sp.]